MSDKNKPATKYDQAVAKSRGQAVNANESTELAPVGEDVTGMLVDSATFRAELEAKINSGEWEAAPQLLTLKKGQTLIAFLEGNGPEAEFVDEQTGVVKNVKTWILSKNGVRVSILSSIQLDKKCPPFVGGMVSITRGEDIRNGASLYTDYLVAGPKRSDGSPRDWSTRPLLATTAGGK
jgi:hypothetical protein